MGSNSRSILISETTFNRLTKGLSSFDDTLDAVITRALDSADSCAQENESASSPEFPSEDGVVSRFQPVPFTRYKNLGYCIPPTADRQEISFTSVKKVTVQVDKSRHNGENSALSLCLQLAIYNLKNMKIGCHPADLHPRIPLTWNGIVLGLAAECLRDRVRKDKTTKPKIGDRESFCGMQIVFVDKNYSAPPNWTSRTLYDDMDICVQGLSAVQGLRTIRLLMAQISPTKDISLCIELEWRDTAKARFPGEKGFLMVNY